MSLFTELIPIPYGYGALLTIASLVVGVIVSGVSLRLSKILRRRYHVYSVSLLTVICAVSVLSALFIREEFLVIYGGQAFTNKQSGGDFVVVTLPWSNYATLNDYYPGGSLYPTTPGLQARQIIEGGEAKYSVHITKLIYSTSLISFLSSITALMIFSINLSMARHDLSLEGHVPPSSKNLEPDSDEAREVENVASPKEESSDPNSHMGVKNERNSLAKILPKHRPDSLDSAHRKFFERIVTSCSDKAYDAQFSIADSANAAARKEWDGYILRSYLKSVFGSSGTIAVGNSPEFASQFQGSGASRGIPLQWSTFNQITNKGIGEESCKKLLSYAAACKSTDLTELLDDFARYYAENGKSSDILAAARALNKWFGE